jgi:hypothetical protein
VKADAVRLADTALRALGAGGARAEARRRGGVPEGASAALADTDDAVEEVMRLRDDILRR